MADLGFSARSTITSTVCVRPSRSNSIARWLLTASVFATTGCPASSMPAADGSVPLSDGANADAPRVDAEPPGCTSDEACDDGASCATDCTVDTCAIASGSCRHRVAPALCAAGEICNAATGCCEPGGPCATSADCEDDDPCTVGETCDPAARVCTFDPLDGDADGDPPRVCGGGDCDDSDATLFSGADELCNGEDEDCDTRIDEGLDVSFCSFCRTENTCGSGRSMHECYVDVRSRLDSLECTNRSAVAAAIGECAMSSCSEYGSCRDSAMATCICGGGRTLCYGGSYCADTSVDGSNCGSCGNVCDAGRACESGVCRCSADRTFCEGTCVDTTTDAENCGSCGHVCPTAIACEAGACPCPAGETECPSRFGGGTVCTDTTTDPEHCGGCGSLCRGVCGTCGGRGACLSSDPENCGTCGNRCAAGEICFMGRCS